MSVLDRSRHRVFHRQMYVDLVRAYLLDYGSQSELARALQLTEAFVSLLLEPPRLLGQTRRDAYWGNLLRQPTYQLTEALKYLKAPSAERAKRLTDQLVSEREYREVLLYHIEQARGRGAPQAADAVALDRDEVTRMVTDIGRVHQTALFGTVPVETRTAYAQVWETSNNVAVRIGSRQPVEHAQVLLFLHDAASALDRHDLALGYAREATLILSTATASNLDSDITARFLINAVAAEAVSLNNLRLHKQALSLVTKAHQLPGYTIEPEHWERTLLEERLKATAGSGRFAIYDAEAAANRAHELIPGSDSRHLGITSRLADVYLAHGSARSLRLAKKLVAELRVAGHESAGAPLRQIRVLRTLARYSRLIGDRHSEAEAVDEWQRIADAANLGRQRTALR